ncbi:MAG: GNAT family N-acetyltransferase [Anaerolineales bacterium]|nr:GNAT family N-acetyltransferase [Anaerolineales bacterium]
MPETPLPPILPAEVLARREQLSLKPVPVTLTGRFVRLEPLIVERDAQPLFEFSNGSSIVLGERSIEAYDADSLIWRYMFNGPFASLADFSASLQEQVDAVNGLCLCVFDLASGRQVGVTNYMNNVPAHLKIELGGIWYSPVAQRSSANTEATYLMLKHAFELGYRRLEWKCHAHNERSRRAALRMGFKFEGIQDNHLIVKGRSRDTAWYRILDTEWPEVQTHLERLLYGG